MVQQTAALYDLDSLSRALIERLDTELSRPATAPSTELLGGVAKAGVALEKLLRESVRTLALQEGRLEREILGKPADRVTAGGLAHGLRDYFRQQGASTTFTVLAADLKSSDSAILAFINVRNQVVKEGGDPARIPGPAKRLKEWALKFRQEAGWN